MYVIISKNSNYVLNNKHLYFILIITPCFSVVKPYTCKSKVIMSKVERKKTRIKKSKVESLKSKVESRKKEKHELKCVESRKSKVESRKSKVERRKEATHAQIKKRNSSHECTN